MKLIKIASIYFLFFFAYYIYEQEVNTSWIIDLLCALPISCAVFSFIDNNLK